MLAVLQWVYGPEGASDPYYLLMQDFILLMPWWYPYMWLGIITAVVGWRGFRRWRIARQNRAGLRRVHNRVRRMADRPARPPLMLRAANDDRPPALLRRRTAD